MLTTNLRTTQTLDSCTGGVSRVRAFATFATTGFAFAGIASIDASWLTSGRKPMPKADFFHPDRWPLHSTS